MREGDEAPVVRMTAVVRGRVQGVGYRDFCRRSALALSRGAERSIRGYARNQADGTVEVVAEGPRGPLEALAESLREGPGMARVASVRVSWSAATREFDRFELR